jgi:hypothetical protein
MIHRDMKAKAKMPRPFVLINQSYSDISSFNVPKTLKITWAVGSIREAGPSFFGGNF